jgi:hypothetical protein
MTDQTPEVVPDRIQRLIDLAAALNTEVEELAGASGKQFVSLAHTAKVNRRLIWLAIVSAVVQLGIIITLAVVVVDVNRNNERLNEVTTEQRKRALCPLYGIFLESRSPEGRAATPDKEKYDHAFEVIAEGYAVLGCGEYLKESGRDKW